VNAEQKTRKPWPKLDRRLMRRHTVTLTLLSTVRANKTALSSNKSALVLSAAQNSPR